MPCGQTQQESNLTILSTPFYEARQARSNSKFRTKAETVILGLET